MLEADNLLINVQIIETIVKIIRRVNVLLAPLLVKNDNMLLLLLLETLSSTSNTSMIDKKNLHCELRTRHIYYLRDISYPTKTLALQLFPSTLLGCHKKARVVYKAVTVVDQKHFCKLLRVRICREYKNCDKSKRRF